MTQEFQYKNLYLSNNLQEWGPTPKKSNNWAKTFPKVVITCRTEHTDPYPNHPTWFCPMINESHDSYCAMSHYAEIRISNFIKQKIHFLNMFYIHMLSECFYQYEKDTDELNELWEGIKPYMSVVDEITGYYKDIDLSSDPLEILKKQSDYNYIKICQFENRIIQKSIWQPSKYAKEMHPFEDLLSTPFMMMIIVQILPSLSKKCIDEADIKKKFLFNLNMDKDEANKIFSRLKKKVSTYISMITLTELTSDDIKDLENCELIEYLPEKTQQKVKNIRASQ